MKQVLKRRLIVNADDFGFTEGVNDGIVAGRRHGILTAATLMANGAAFDHAIALSAANPELDIGCHLVLIGGHSVADPGRALPRTLPALLRELALGRLAVLQEFRAQIGKILAAGIRPTHLDTHKHTHLAPPVLEAIARVSREFCIPWVRRPFDLPITSAGVPLTQRALSGVLGLLRSRVQGVLERHGCRTTDHFAGFQITGRFGTPELVSLIAKLPRGLTEFMCHPGYHTAALEAAPTRLKASREAELRALMAPEARRALELYNVELVCYREVDEEGNSGRDRVPPPELPS